MKGWYRQWGKRVVDILLGATALLVLAPLMLAVAVLVRVGLGRPVLFRQERPGLRGELFTLYKFRTMLVAYDRSGRVLPDAHRMSRVGSLLRSLSLDELPELWNVVRGDMSLVGPRPLLTQYLDRYSPEQARRHDVRPGITGWAQVNGRNALSWEEKFTFDVWYVDNVSCPLDLKILALTILKTLSREGISAPGHVTAGEFQGSHKERG